MDIIKEQVYKLYRTSANLNLYMYLCNPNREIVMREIKSIKDIIEETEKYL